jgi:hypothetical protein
VPPTPTQLAWRGRIESVLRLAAPALDLMLAAGDRVSRVVDRDAPDWTPPRPVEEPRVQRRVGPGSPPAG